MNESVIARTFTSDKSFLSKYSAQILRTDASRIEEQGCFALTQCCVGPTVTSVYDLQFVFGELLCLVNEDVIVLDSPELAIYFLLVLGIGEYDPRSIGQSELMVASPPAVPQFGPLPHELVYMVALDLIPHATNNTAISARSLLPAVEHDALQAA